LPTRQPDPSLAWEDLSAADRRALTELLVDKTVIAPHPHKIDKDGRRPLSRPHKIDKDGRRHYLVRTRSTKTAGATISSAQDRQRRQEPLSHPRHPYQDPEMEAERLKAVHEALVKIIPQSLNSVGKPIAHRFVVQLSAHLITSLRPAILVERAATPKRI
jgi:hypothetical protein